MDERRSFIEGQGIKSWSNKKKRNSRCSNEMFFEQMISQYNNGRCD